MTTSNENSQPLRSVWLRAMVASHRNIVLTFLVTICSPPAHAKTERTTVSAQVGAFAPNAGGQEAYALRLAKGDNEFAGFANTYLLAGGRPLLGATWSKRFAICGDECWWKFYAQVGAGATTAGPVIDTTWSMNIPLLPIWLPRPAFPWVPALRLDVSTHFIGVRSRVVVWSYPLWAGVSVPF